MYKKNWPSNRMNAAAILQ